MNKFDYKTLTPFKWFVLENFPFIEADFDALTEWQLFCKLGKEMNKIIDSQNKVGEEAEKLNEAFIALQNYINNYFDNLDVQEEVNKKLNEMAQSGELAEIISKYLDLKAVIGYDNSNSLALATNLIKGSIVRTLGRNNYSDGEGGFYRVRQRTNQDIIDGYYLILLQNTTNLLAERIKDTEIDNINDEINSIHADIAELQNPTKKFVFIGDSYLQGYTPAGEVENWGKKFASILGLADNQWRRIAKGGTAINNVNSNNFYELIKDIQVDSTVTDVILAAGYNDHTDAGTETSVLDGMRNFSNAIKVKFPNAKLYVAFIGNTSIVNDKYGVMSRVAWYIRACNLLNIQYMNNVEYALHNYGTEFATDGIHPNADGEETIAKALVQAYKTGSADIQRNRIPVVKAGSSFLMTQSNDRIDFISNGYYAAQFDTPKTITMTGGNYILMYQKFDNHLAVGSGSVILSNSSTIPVFFVTSSNKTLLVDCKVVLDNGFLLLYPFALNSTGTNYLTETLTAFQIRPFTFSMNALYN